MIGRNPNQQPFVIMKQHLSTLLVISALVAPKALCATYSDATGETVFGGMLDITSVEVNNTATALSFKINLAGDPVATDWGKYLIGIDSAAGGDTAGDPWVRPIRMSSGMDYFVGSWVNFGNGGEIYNWSGASWGLQSATYNANPDAIVVSKDTSSVTLTFNFAGLGLVGGSTFNFDVFTTGGSGSDSAIDALGNPAQSIANWGDTYDSASNVKTYTIAAVPEPTSAALLAAVGLFALRRKLG